MSITTFIRPKEATQIPEPPIARFLFADTRMAWLWLIVRRHFALGLQATLSEWPLRPGR